MLPDDVELIQIDFDANTSYTNKVMRTMRYRVLLDGYLPMVENVNFSKKAVGGFDLITFAMAADTKIILQFY